MSDIETVTWPEFLASFRWAQGEHVAVIAPTGAGKTTLISRILPIRKYVIFFGTKGEDKLYDELIRKHGYRRVESVRDINVRDERIILWPKWRRSIPETVAVQRARFAEAFDYIAAHGRWTAVYDESKYMAESLKLGTYLTFCQEQLRSMKGTNVSGAQRPFWLPRSVLSSASHVFLWRTTDADDMKRLADIGGVDKTMIRREMSGLGKHEFIYIHTRGTDARMVRSQVKG